MIYKFSPIDSKDKFDKTLVYLTRQLEQLSLKHFGQKLPINTLKVFAHYPDEYHWLLEHVKSLGSESPFSSDTSFYAEVNQKISGYQISYIGVRVVDPYRLQVGCGDYEIDWFDKFKEEQLNRSEYVRLFSKDMVEIWHPDFDVLGYVVPPL